LDHSQRIIKRIDSNFDSKSLNEDYFDFFGKKLESKKPGDFDTKEWRDLCLNESNPEKYLQYLSKWIQDEPAQTENGSWLTKSNYTLRAEKMLQFGQYKYAITDADQVIQHGSNGFKKAYGYLLKSRGLLGLNQVKLAKQLIQKASG
jgi:hypothetical protein